MYRRIFNSQKVKKCKESIFAIDISLVQTVLNSTKYMSDLFKSYE